MARLLALVAWGVLAFASAGAISAQSDKRSGTRAALEADDPDGHLPNLPPLPAGASTIFGGAIRSVDPVQDRILLDVYGQHPMKILFDERTQLYRNGMKIPIHDLKPAEHASVQTALDGTGIFAVSIHILTQAPQGDFRGRVLAFNRATGVLKLDATPSPPFTVVVASTAAIARKGQRSFSSQPSGPSDLKPGTLVTVTFASAGGGQAVASAIDVWAVPGSSFIFGGTISALDMANGSMVIVDPRDDTSYELHFYPRQVYESQKLHIGARVRVKASYDGSNYLAAEIQLLP